MLAVLAIRIGSYLTAAVKYRRFAALHTWMNKATGLAVFLIPGFLRTALGVPYCWLACGIAGLASAEELLIHLCRKEYDSRVKWIGMAVGTGGLRTDKPE